MRNAKPAATWIIFALATFLVAAVMLYFSIAMLRFERASARSQSQAALEENIRLALWRMDSIAASLLAAQKRVPTDAAGIGHPRGADRRQPDNQAPPNANSPQSSLGSQVSQAGELPSKLNLSKVPQRNGGSQVQGWSRFQPDVQEQISQNELRIRADLSGATVGDWKPIEPELLSSVSDLIQGAHLEDVDLAKADPNDTRRLASVPARLIVDPRADSAVLLSWNSPLRISLIIAWVCALLSVVSVAVLLHRTLTLSERRASFVSVVTHELRTPITTCRLYAEMLAGNMVQKPVQRAQYLATLVNESDRLGLLVDNVLAYSRLERRLSPRQAVVAPLTDLVTRALPALRVRASQSGFEIVLMSPPHATLPVRVDEIAVQQILINLVDNACKYGKGPIHITIDRRERQAIVGVRDHGPGVPAVRVRGLFRAFEKDPTDTAPGIGLGLHLSRRYARDIGGDLKYVPGESGAAWELLLQNCLTQQMERIHFKYSNCLPSFRFPAGGNRHLTGREAVTAG